MILVRREAILLNHVMVIFSSKLDYLSLEMSFSCNTFIFVMYSSYNSFIFYSHGQIFVMQSDIRYVIFSRKEYSLLEGSLLQLM